MDTEKHDKHGWEGMQMPTSALGKDSLNRDPKIEPESIFSLENPVHPWFELPGDD
jgi:hypothetical protein